MYGSQLRKMQVQQYFAQSYLGFKDFVLFMNHSSGTLGLLKKPLVTSGITFPGFGCLWIRTDHPQHFIGSKCLPSSLGNRSFFILEEEVQETPLYLTVTTVCLLKALQCSSECGQNRTVLSRLRVQDKGHIGCQLIFQSS